MWHRGFGANPDFKGVSINQVNSFKEASEGSHPFETAWCFPVLICKNISKSVVPHWAPSTKLWGGKHVFVKCFVAAGVSGYLSAVCKLLQALSVGCSSLSDIVGQLWMFLTVTCTLQSRSIWQSLKCQRSTNTHTSTQVLPVELSKWFHSWKCQDNADRKSVV